MNKDSKAGLPGVPRRSLLGAALCFAAGVAAGARGPSVWPYAALAWGGGGVAWLRFRMRWNTVPMRAACLVAVVAAGALAGAGARIQRTQRLGRLKPFYGRDVRIEATLGGIPEDRGTGRAGVRIDALAHNVILQCENGETAIRRIRIRWYGPDMRGDPDGGIGILPHSGERWSLTGKLYAPLRPGSLGTAGEPLLIANADASARLGKAFPLHPGFLLTRLGARLRRCLTHGLEGREQAEGMLSAMLLGKRSNLPPDLTRSFRQAGTYHVFAISGLHVGIISLIGMWGLALLKVARRNWIFFLLPLLGLFVVMSGARPSAVRAGLMVAFFLLGISIGKRSDGLCSLAAAALLILCLRPLQVFDVGFQMSFAVVGGLLVMTRPLLQRLERLTTRRGDALTELAAAAGVGPRRPVWDAGGLVGGALRRLRAFVLPLLAVSLAAWLVALPLTAYFFQQVSLVGVLANLLVTPLAFLVVLCGVLSLAGGLFWEGFSLFFNQINLGLTGVMAFLTRTAAGLPGAGVEVPAIPWWSVVVAETLLWRLVGGNSRLGENRIVEENI